MLPYNGLNFIYLYQWGDVGAARELCERQISQNKNHFWGHSSLGWACLGEGDLARAAEAYTTALEIHPGATLDHFRLGHTYRLQRRYDEAVAVFLRIPSIDETEYSAYYDAAVVYQIQGDESSARHNFERYLWEVEKRLESEPEKASHYIDAALVLSHLGQDERSRSMGRKALEIDPSQHFGYAQLLAAQGNKQEALDRLELAIENGFSNYVWIKVNSDFAGLEEEPRFQALLAKHLK
jgi:adenylate cyclase